MTSMCFPDTRVRLFALLMLLLALSACGSDNEPEYVPPKWSYGFHPDSVGMDPHPKQIEFEGVNPEGLKILAIGNSYSNNATQYLPWIFDRLGEDSDVFIARLYRGGASLEMHWNNHVADREDYTLHYSHGGEWHEVSITTIDEALQVFDWDIVVMQQMSVFAGLDYTYQPYLDYLRTLVYDTNSCPKLAWHYTWAYTSAATWQPNFAYFDYDPDLMYESVISTCDRMSGDFDFRIPSGQLIKMLRDNFPEQEDGFSSDGVHLTDPACYALSCLWHEVLVSPISQSSCLDFEESPEGISIEFSNSTKTLIKKLLQEFDTNEVPQVRI